MTFVVTEACIRCKYTDCVDVCPVDAFCEGPKATLNKSPTGRASTGRAVCGVANPRHSPSYGCGLRLATHHSRRRPPSRGLIQRRPNFLVIDPDECIDCAVCVPECPVNAIYADEDVPADQQDFTPLNAELARLWKPITKTKMALPDADAWAPITVKRTQLTR